MQLRRELEVAPEKDKPQAAQAKVKEHKAVGTLYIDNSAGRVIEYNNKAETKLEYTVQGQVFAEMARSLRLQPNEKTPRGPAAPEKK